MSVILKLSKYVVPYFHITIAVTTYCTAWFTTAVFFSTVIINLGTRTARTSTVFPEVIFFTKLENAFWSDSNLISPNGKCLVIF